MVHILNISVCADTTVNGQRDRPLLNVLILYHTTAAEVIQNYILIKWNEITDVYIYIYIYRKDIAIFIMTPPLTFYMKYHCGLAELLHEKSQILHDIHWMYIEMCSHRHTLNTRKFCGFAKAKGFIILF